MPGMKAKRPRAPRQTDTTLSPPKLRKGEQVVLRTANNVYTVRLVPEAEVRKEYETIGPLWESAVYLRENGKAVRVRTDTHPSREMAIRYAFFRGGSMAGRRGLKKAARDAGGYMGGVHGDVFHEGRPDLIGDVGKASVALVGTSALANIAAKSV